MRQFQAPDMIVIALTYLPAALGLFLASMFLEGLLQTVVIGLSISPPSILTILWWSWNQSLRLKAYRLYYRFRGPRCTMEILGTIPTYTNEEKELLQSVIKSAKQWCPSAEPSANFLNRTIIDANPRTLTADVLTEYDEELEEDHEYSIIDRWIEFRLYGYAETLSGLDSLMSTEVASILSRLAKICREDSNPSFTMKAAIEGTNPFMVFSHISHINPAGLVVISNGTT